MATPETLTRELYERRLKLQDIVVTRTQSLWGQVPFENLNAGWDRVAVDIVREVTNGQLASATLSDPYVTAVGQSVGVPGLPSATDPRLYAGVAPDGRELEPLLYGAVTTTKHAIGAGMGLEAMLQGAAFLAAAVKSAMADMGRMADMNLTLGRGYKSYVRAVSPGACSRCAILAGIYSGAVAFQRHPNCQCIAVPVPNLKRAAQMGFAESPEEYFSSLSVAEQNRIFTVAGAKAIRDGADIYQVVNARRGAPGIAYGAQSFPTPNSGRRMRPVQIGTRPDGSPLLVYMTGEGTSRFGLYGRGEIARREAGHRSTTLRLMPEQIYRMAGNDPDKARDLLIRYGYIFVP